MATITIPGAVSGGSLGINAKKLLDGSAPSVVWQIPPRIGTLTVQSFITSPGTYRVETTASPIEDVQNDSADWFDAYGADQSASSMKSIIAAVTAVKITRISGTQRVCIRGQ